MTLEEELKKLLEEVGFESENKGIFIMCSDDETKMEDMINFIIKNNLNFNHLWEDSEEGDKAYKDYERIVGRVLSYEGINLDMEKVRRKVK